MAPERASRTAELVAAYRGRATSASDRLCHDPWAAALAGEEGAQLVRRLDSLQPHMQLWIALRTAFFDDAVRRLTELLPQVVVLGAGFDTRAARLSRDGVRFFEVDTPDSQQDKLARLRRLEGYPLEAATYVQCDFETDEFLERLARAGFDRARPAVVVWEGVTYYLTEPTVRAVLRRIAAECHPDTTVLFDFVGKKMAQGRVRDVEDAQTRRLVAELGEPLRWGTDDVLPLLYAEGYRRVHVTSFDEICLNRTGTYDRARKFRFQFISEASPGLPDPP